MPKINDKIFCINHLHKEMDEYDAVMINHTEKKGPEGKYYWTTKVIIGVPYICSICKYTELYAFTDALDAPAEPHDQNQEKVDN